MAYYAALIPVIQLLDDILHRNQYPELPLGQNTILKALHEKFSLLEDSLQGYSSKGSEANDHVEEQIRDVAYQVQDIIECELSHQILVSRREARATESSTPFHEVKESIVQKLFSYFKLVVCRQKRHVDYLREKLHEMDSFVQEIDSVLEEVMAIKEEDATEGFKLSRDSFKIPDNSERATSVSSNTIVGLDADLTAIKEMLCGQSTKLQVIPVVGMGGIGKTTLARTTFDDALIVEHFDRRIWVTVSQDYHLNQVLESIKSCLNLEDDDDKSPLEERIYKHLYGRRYLIVIDDVWNTNVWDDVRRLFPDDSNGSRIMLTTRLLDVARYAATSDILHEMQCLNDDRSWNLLKMKVFAQENCPCGLEHIGKDIARQCHGLPLALVVVAGILSEVKTQDSWEKISTNVRAILRHGDESSTKSVLSILSLSYNHLSHQLKACFLYMASFPDGHEIDISNLISLWIAEGFLKSGNKPKSLEELGEECLHDLVKRNLVMMKKASYGESKFCILHDVLRDFCRQRALYERFFHVIYADKDNYMWPHPRHRSYERRIIINFNHYSWRVSCSIDELLRSILIFGEVDELTFHGTEWKRCILLRVLDISQVRRVISFHSELFHLKYLKLKVDKHSCSLIKDLGEWISMLVNLQTIMLTVQRSSPGFCFQIWKMAQLRHVIISDHFLLPPVGKFTGYILEYLQTLMNVEDFTITDEVVKMIPNIRKLALLFKKIEDRHCLHHLVRFRHLEELQISYGGHYPHSYVSFPSSFALPSHLRELYLQDFKISGDLLKVIGSLPNLQVLKLEFGKIDRREWVVTEGEFPQLKFLLMGTLNLMYWRAEGSLFPCLDILKIRNCRDLEEIPLEIGDIPALRLIEVHRCSICKLSVIKIRKDQQELGNESLRVRIYP